MVFIEVGSGHYLKGVILFMGHTTMDLRIDEPYSFGRLYKSDRLKHLDWKTEQWYKDAQQRRLVF